MSVGLMAPAASGVTVAKTGPVNPFQCRSTGVFLGTRPKADPVTVTLLPAWPELELRLSAARLVHANAADARARTPTVVARAPTRPRRVVRKFMNCSFRPHRRRHPKKSPSKDLSG